MAAKDILITQEQASGAPKQVALSPVAGEFLKFNATTKNPESAVVSLSDIGDMSAAARTRNTKTDAEVADLLPVGSATQAVLDTKATKNGEGTNFVVVDVSADDAVTNGANLLAAYAAAKLLTPNGAALSASNRVAVIIPPAVYDLVTTPLTLDTQFVDLVGLTGDPKHLLITSAVNALNSGTIVQTADDIRVKGATVQNTGTVTLSFNSSDPGAYVPTGSFPTTLWSDCVFKGNGADIDEGGTGSFPTRWGATYSGTFIRCAGADYIFGQATFSGTAIGCVGGAGSFGSGSVFSGTAKDCVGAGTAFGGAGTFSGTASNCVAGNRSYGGEGDCTGTASNCVGGDGSFGAGGTLTGKLYYCRISGSVEYGSFATVSAAGLTRYCLDGGNVANNQG